MRKLLVCVLLCIALCGCAESRLSAPAKYIRLLGTRHIQRGGDLYLETHHGSGFVANIDGKPWFVTATHVLQSEAGELAWNIPYPVIGEPVYLEDAALLPLKEGDGYDIGYAMPGEKVCAIGFPGKSAYPMRLYGTVTKHGYMTGLVECGMSGGPVLNRKGQVIGVISAYLPYMGLSKYTLIPSSLEE